VAVGLRTWRDRRRLHAERQSADEQLLASRLPSPRHAWRTEELVSEDNRTALGRSLTDAVHASDERLLPSASPLDRNAIRACRAPLLELASHLHDPDRQVTPRGVLLAERLLTNGSGPLYGHGEPRRLRLEVKRIAAALDGDD
jgi:hypothetical protein